MTAARKLAKLLVYRESAGYLLTKHPISDSVIARSGWATLQDTMYLQYYDWKDKTFKTRGNHIHSLHTLLEVYRGRHDTGV